jgi:hypothetical protein
MLFSTLAARQSPPPAPAAVTPSEDLKDLRPARVGPNGATLYFGGKPGCPQDDSCKLPPAQALKAGDLVFVRPEQKGFTPLASSKANHFVLRGSLEPVPFEAHPAAKSWIGLWRLGDATIRIAQTPEGSLTVHGNAVWHGEGSDHAGEFQAAVPLPETNVVNLHDEHNAACEVHLALFATRMVAEDNEGCGGANVRFRGEFEPVPATPKR